MLIGLGKAFLLLSVNLKLFPDVATIAVLYIFQSLSHDTAAWSREKIKQKTRLTEQVITIYKSVFQPAHCTAS